jgi:hypothetical protein
VRGACPGEVRIPDDDLELLTMQLRSMVLDRQLGTHDGGNSFAGEAQV